jgi:antitoxin (DNA-binding transcriptional repressor) of toxin-antitoxin stability system
VDRPGVAPDLRAGETFTVVRNSRPVFRITPLETRSDPPGTSKLRDIRRRFADKPVSRAELPQKDLAGIIADVRRRLGKSGT